MRSLGVAAVLAILATPAALAQSALPDPARTPGAMNPEVTQATIGTTICVRGGPERFARRSNTPALKRQQIREFGYADRKLGDIRRGPLVPPARWLPTIPELMARARTTADGWNADLKDELEAFLARLVCSGRPLAEAQQAIAADWTAAYNRFVVGK